jgi:hypothetical protein
LIHGSLAESVEAMRALGISPRYLLMDVGESRETVLADIEAIAMQCEPGTRVVAIGRINDIQFYRQLTDSGVPDYFPLPVAAADIIAAFKRQDAPALAAAPIARLAIDYYLLGKRPDEPVAKVEVSPDAQSAQSRADANKPENKKPEANKPEANKPESGKPELQKADPTKPEAQPNKPEVKKSEASKPPSAPAPANATGVAKTNAQRSAP